MSRCSCCASATPRPLEALGKRQGLNAEQAKCLSRTIAGFPDEKVVALGNASEGKREKILVGVVEGCAK